MANYAWQAIANIVRSFALSPSGSVGSDYDSYSVGPWIEARLV